MSAAEEAQALGTVCGWVGSLLLRELDAGMLRELRECGAASQLEELGLCLPGPEEESAWLDERAADYHDLFLSPEGAPLVQSLWQEGRYEGRPAARMRTLAGALGLELDREAARGAAPDHLGCILQLWSASQAAHPEVAAALLTDHLDWAANPLRRIQERSGFYGALAGLTLELCQALDGSAPGSMGESPVS